MLRLLATSLDLTFHGLDTASAAMRFICPAIPRQQNGTRRLGYLTESSLRDEIRSIGSTSNPWARFAMGRGRVDGASVNCPAVQKYLLDRSVWAHVDNQTAKVWEQFFREEQIFICQIAVNSGVQREVAEDCVQQTWLELLTRIPDLESNGNPDWLRHWLHKVVRSKLSNERRMKRRHLAVSLHDSLDEVLSYEIHYGEELESKELKDCMRQAMSVLRKRVQLTTYRVVRMRFVRGLSVRQVCDKLQLSRQQVWDRQRIGLRKLASILRRFGYDELRFK